MEHGFAFDNWDTGNFQAFPEAIGFCAKELSRGAVCGTSKQDRRTSDVSRHRKRERTLSQRLCVKLCTSLLLVAVIQVFNVRVQETGTQNIAILGGVQDVDELRAIEFVALVFDSVRSSWLVTKLTSTRTSTPPTKLHK